MKWGMITVFGLVVVVLAALAGVAAGGVVNESSGIPNPCIEAYDEATMATHHRGYSWSSDRAPEEVFSNEAGNCVVRFEDREHSAPLEVSFSWNGKHKETIPVDPFKEVGTLGLVYTYDWIIRADGSYDIQTYDPVRQVWWCGVNIGECHLATYDAFFSAECIAAGKDPNYGYAPGTGPACVAHTYEKVNGLVIVD